jgi:hypothetical protein
VFKNKTNKAKKTKDKGNKIVHPIDINWSKRNLGKVALIKTKINKQINNLIKYHHIEILPNIR